ncbi:metalloregulator ArsR/SmtB family transcription factor [Neorhizobium sp. T786]|uniref:ArsR/SmtB family transcription factor n=1 Tax=Pseudorhizobium xiangyangii TaxID=2883104 RepID=UPI001D001695|nr:metalloregulator ArsR/SmtB family transcription factor [Neorhizobium xiangyangii]MCB5202093.1 metalloregulator ArsR/SmtB family transcription factor [Neorhizobium xiangyangii]
MVELHAEQMNTVFHALGDGTRRRMLHALASGERTVGELAEPFEISLAAASKHIKVLETAGLIRREVRGRSHVCRLDSGPLASAHAWLSFYERFWNDRLAALEKLLREEDAARVTRPDTAGKPKKPAGTGKPAKPSTPERKSEEK